MGLQHGVSASRVERRGNQACRSRMESPSATQSMAMCSGPEERIAMPVPCVYFLNRCTPLHYTERTAPLPQHAMLPPR